MWFESKQCIWLKENPDVYLEPHSPQIPVELKFHFLSSCVFGREK